MEHIEKSFLSNSYLSLQLSSGDKCSWSATEKHLYSSSLHCRWLVQAYSFDFLSLEEPGWDCFSLYTSLQQSRILHNQLYKRLKLHYSINLSWIQTIQSNHSQEISCHASCIRTSATAYFSQILTDPTLKALVIVCTHAST